MGAALVAALFCSKPASAGKVEYSELDLSTVRIFSMLGVDKQEVEAKKNGRHYTLAVPIAGHGSGYLVSTDGLVLTARHVVEGARQVVVKEPGSRVVYPAEVVYSYRAR